MRLTVITRSSAIALVVWLASATGANADAVYRVTILGTEMWGVDSNSGVVETVPAYTASFDITALELPSDLNQSGRFRFEILSWTDPLSYTDQLQQRYWTEPGEPVGSFLTGQWDPERGSFHVQAEMVNRASNQVLSRLLWNGEGYTALAGLDPIFHFIPMNFLAWETASGPTSETNYFGAARVSEIVPTPEPATLLFVGTGIGLLAARRRRSRKDTLSPHS